jgi:hypothetical protein
VFVAIVAIASAQPGTRAQTVREYYWSEGATYLHLLVLGTGAGRELAEIFAQPPPDPELRLIDVNNGFRAEFCVPETGREGLERLVEQALAGNVQAITFAFALELGIAGSGPWDPIVRRVRDEEPRLLARLRAAPGGGGELAAVAIEAHRLRPPVTPAEVAPFEVLARGSDPAIALVAREIAARLDGVSAPLRAELARRAAGGRGAGADGAHGVRGGRVLRIGARPRTVRPGLGGARARGAARAASPARGAGARALRERAAGRHAPADALRLDARARPAPAN